MGSASPPSGGLRPGCAAPILPPILLGGGTDMPDQTPNALTQWSEALAALVAGSAGLVASIHTPHHRPRSGTLWRPDVVIGSEQVFPKADTAEIVVAGGRRIAARLAGRCRTAARRARRGARRRSQRRAAGAARHCPRSRPGLAQPSRRPHRPPDL